MNTLFEETEIPTWEQVKIRVHCLPRGYKSLLAAKMGITPSRLSQLLKAEDVNTRTYFGFLRGLTWVQEGPQYVNNKTKSNKHE